MLFVITIYGEVMSSKNSKRIVKAGNRPFLISSKAYLSYAESALMQLNAQRGVWDEMVAKSNYPYCVGFYFWRRTDRQFDYLNLCQGIADLMVKAGYMPDDSMIFFKPFPLGWDKDKDNPRVELTIVTFR